MNEMYLLKVSVACFANNNDAYVPEAWALEGLAILEENMVTAGLVHRDFQNEVANYGDVVNTRRPGTFKAKRKTDADSIVLQDANATNVQVPLNQHFYISFTIKDGEASKSFQDLLAIYVVPSMQGIARSIDQVICGQSHRFLANVAGKLEGLTGLNSKDYLLEVREKMNKNKAYADGRQLILSPTSETALLKTDLFIRADQRGDGGSAMSRGLLGHVLGFDTYMAQNQPGVWGAASVDTFTKIVEQGAAGAVAGTTTVTVNAAGDTPVEGAFVTFANDGQPRWCFTGTVDASIVIEEPLKYDVANLALATVYNKCNVNAAGVAGYAKEIILDGYVATKEPQIGQMLAFGITKATRHTYTIIDAYENPSNAAQTLVLLDRPLDLTVTATDPAFPGPLGAYNLAFHRDALALVTRPLALPNTQMGCRAAVAAYNNVGMRVTMQYDIATQGTIVTMDLLAGVALLDVNLGCVLLG
jgi:hypothetical protein